MRLRVIPWDYTKRKGRALAQVDIKWDRAAETTTSYSMVKTLDGMTIPRQDSHGLRSMAMNQFQPVVPQSGNALTYSPCHRPGAYILSCCDKMMQHLIDPYAGLGRARHNLDSHARLSRPSNLA